MSATARVNGLDPKKSNSAAFNESSAKLADTFEYFNSTSAQLMQTYRSLENRINELTSDLDRVSAEKDEVHSKKELIASRMQALLDFLPGGVIVLDPHGYVIQSNPAAREMLGHSLQGSLWRSVISDCFSPRNDDGLEVSTKSGRRISIATGSLGSDMHSDGQIMLLTDLTETRDLQKKLSRNERLSAMGKMVSALAHQIRTPLSAAILYAGHLCDESLDAGKRKLFSHKILSRLHHMERQVRDMLLFVKSELPLNDQMTIAGLEYELREATEVILSSSGLDCEWRSEANDKVKIKCHRDALVSAIVNLINNAVQACPSDSDREPYLSVDISQQDGFVRIAIADKGAGMDEDALASVQEIFVTTKPQGTGLGLAVVNAVTRAHGGEFELQSVLGEGTTASVLIPIVN